MLDPKIWDRGPKPGTPEFPRWAADEFIQIMLDPQSKGGEEARIFLDSAAQKHASARGVL